MTRRTGGAGEAARERRRDEAGRRGGTARRDGEPAGTLDLAVSRNGVAADAAVSFIVGDSRP
ncbi:hypothetical protein AB0B42_20820, partial [Streptomyces fradiae]